MILHPAVIALLTGSILVSLMAVYSSYHGLRILRGWDLTSGSEFQLGLEKKTYLISTVMAYAFGFLILSFFLFIFTAEDLHRLFVGAMCAAGTLNVNGYGYPALLLKIANSLAAGVWLIVNYTDNRAFDYPLIRKKYALLLAITPFIVAETALQAAYFLNLEANVITSCCGSLFSAGLEGVASSLAALPVAPMRVIFFGAMGLTLASGVHFYLKGTKTGALFSLAGTATFFVSIAALISFISLYIYELPTHHCPFCILQGEYHYLGYPLYITLLGGGISVAGAGTLLPFRNVPSLREVVPRLQKGLTRWTLALYLIFTGIVVFRMASTGFILTGY